MHRLIPYLVLSLTVVSLAALAPLPARASDTPEPLFPKVALETTHGEIVLALDGRRAPLTVKNFLRYVQDGHYDGTVFHRVIEGFVVQGGGYTGEYEEKPTREPIPNESGNGLSNRRGTIAMARQDQPHTATSQFYFNLADNSKLDPQSSRWGYTVFGEVTEGMDVVDEIAALPTGPAGPFASDVPQSGAMVLEARLIED